MPTDYAALAEQARRSTPVDYAALAEQARRGGNTPGPWSSGYVPAYNENPAPPMPAHHRGGNRGLTGRDPRDKETPIPGQIADLMEGTAKYSSGAAIPAFAAAPVAAIGGAVAGAAGQFIGQHGASAMGAEPEAARLVGDIAALPAAALGARGAQAGVSAIKAARTPNPDLMMGKAVNPHPADTEFKKYIPKVRENMQRGAQLTGVPITDVDSALAATDASMKEHMDALEMHKENARRQQAKLPTSVIKAKQIEAIPKGLETRDPQAYNDAVSEISAQFPNTPYLDTDQVFDQAILNNNQLSAFHSGKADAQSTKLITNSGDTAVLKAAGDTYRQWIADNLGPIAKGYNEDWGNMNGVKHYLANKVNPAFLQGADTPLAGAMDSVGVHPGQSMKHSLIQGVAGRIAGQPEGIDARIQAAFEHTEPAEAPWTPNRAPYLISAPEDASGPIPPAARDFRSATSGWDAPDRLLPAASSTIGVSGVTVPDLAGEAQQAQNRMMTGPKQIPAATSTVGVSGTTVPDIVGSASRGQGTPVPLLEAAPGGSPSAGVVQPVSEVSGPGAKTIGPATPMPLPKAGNTLGLDEFGRPVRPATLNREQRRASTEVPEEGIPEDVARSQSMGTTQAQELNIAQRIGQQIRRGLDGGQ